MREIYVFGDSHWRTFFPFVNTGSPGVAHEQEGYRIVDMVANELSGATMYGLLNPNSKNGARRRILGDLDRIGGVENVGLVFGEVDCRYPQHHDRYFRPDGTLMVSEVQNLLARYRRFIEEDLFATGRVRDRAFVYFGFTYPKGPQTLLQPNLPMGDMAFNRARTMVDSIGQFIRPSGHDTLRVGDPILRYSRAHGKIVPIVGHPNYADVSADGVHLETSVTFGKFIMPALRQEFEPSAYPRREVGI